MLHGAIYGPVVVIQDVSLDQWHQRKADGRIVINDFDQLVVLRRNISSLPLLIMRGSSADGAGGDDDNESSNDCK